MTGGAGFIGSNLVGELIEAGYSVVVLDRRVPNPEILREVEFIRGDVRNGNCVMRSLRGAEGVVHLAGLTDTRASSSQPMLYHKVNVDGTLQVLLGCAKLSVGTFVMASSAGVYGRAKVYPTPESEPLAPLSPYAATKAVAEMYCQAVSRQGGFTGVVLRFFNVYGDRHGRPRNDVVSRVLDALESGKRPVVNGTGNQTRDFIHVDDVARVVVASLKRNVSGVFNVGTGVETSVNRLVRLAQNVTRRRDLKPRHVPGNQIEIFRSVADTSKLRRELGVSRLVTIDAGIELWALTGKNRAGDAIGQLS